MGKGRSAESSCLVRCRSCRDQLVLTHNSPCDVCVKYTTGFKLNEEINSLTNTAFTLSTRMSHLVPYSPLGRVEGGEMATIDWSGPRTGASGGNMPTIDHNGPSKRSEVTMRFRMKISTSVYPAGSTYPKARLQKHHAKYSEI